MLQKFYLKRFFVVFLLIPALNLYSCEIGDSDDPAAINNLSFNCSTGTFSWTATGDDGNDGLAAIYDLRFFEAAEMAALLGVPVESLESVPDSAIVEAFRENFPDARQIMGEPPPKAAGAPEELDLNPMCPELIVVEPNGGTSTFDCALIFPDGEEIFFAITARDEVGNQASIESVLRIDCQM